MKRKTTILEKKSYQLNHQTQSTISTIISINSLSLLLNQTSFGVITFFEIIFFVTILVTPINIYIPFYLIEMNEMMVKCVIKYVMKGEIRYDKR